jgi:hypothetical protein
MSQDEHLERVSDKIATYVAEFCFHRNTFHMEELTEYVSARVSPIAPDSPGRILRMLRREKVLNYEIVNRRESLYRITPVLPEVDWEDELPFF